MDNNFSTFLSNSTNIDEVVNNTFSDNEKGKRATRDTKTTNTKKEKKEKQLSQKYSKDGPQTIYELPDNYNDNIVMKNGNFVPETSSILKQVKCPRSAKSKYGKYKSIPFVIEEMIPEALGYVLGYGFTGRGSNDSKYVLQRMGVTGDYDDRVLGYNYFVDTNTNCSQFGSDKECAGKKNWMYVRSIPTMDNKGLWIGGMLEDISDLNPMDMLEALWGKGKFSGKCKKRTLPVGSNLLNKSKKFNSRKDYLENAKSCISNCKNKYQNESRSYLISNCYKKCAEGYFLETKCTATDDKYTYGDKEYFQSNKSKCYYIGKIIFLIVLFLFIAYFVIEQF